jgi:competence protein ComEC
MRLAFLSAALASGIVCGLHGEVVLLWGLASAGSAALATLLCLRSWNLSLGLGTLLLGLGLGWWQVKLAAAPAPVAEDQPVRVLAQVVRGSDVAEASLASSGDDGGSEGGAGRRALRSHLRLRVAAIDDRPLAATLSLTVLDGVPEVAPGDWVRFAGRLYLPRGFANPGLPDARLLARGQGIDLLACVRRPSDLVAADGPRSPLAYARRWAFALRRALAAAINQRLREPAAGFVRTMVIGERTVVPLGVEEGFRAAGATHVLSVSGLHLAVVVALVFHLLKWLAGRAPAWALRLSPKVLASALALPATAFYTLVTGEAVATVRAAIMASGVLGAALVNRPASLAACLGAAALLLLLASPAAILDVSFQLSFLSVIGLGLFARWLLPGGREAKVSGWRCGWRWLRRSLSASSAACLLTMPVVAHHFGEITPVAPLGNLVLVPIVEMLVLPCGLVGALLALGQPWLGALPLWAAGWGARLALGLAELFRAWAPVFSVRYPNAGETLLLVAGAACTLQALVRWPRRPNPWWIVAVAAAALAAASLGAREAARLGRQTLRVTFLDVGQGDAILIEGPRGFTALVDGGGRYDGSFDTGARIVEPVLRAAGISRLDLVVLSHPHPDHLNGLLRILERFPVGALWTHGDSGRNPTYGDLIEVAERHRVPRPSPGRLVWNDLVVEAVGPWYAGTIGVPPGLSTNDASLVLRLRYHGRRVLLTGDIGDEGEAELLDRRREGLDLEADVLKVPHHGSRHASSAPFVDAVSPKLAVVTAGRFNRFGLPSPAAVARYAERGVEVRRTDRDGAVAVTLDPQNGLQVACQRGCAR